jgi:protein-S-isoprenylcysteine O-methyltransferase Ste14
MTNLGLYTFEKTAEVIETGIFRYIRHPLYGSLIFFTWGIYFKHAEKGLLRIVVATIFLAITSLVEEQENIAYFGEKYNQYMKRTRMFVPFIM